MQSALQQGINRCFPFVLFASIECVSRIMEMDAAVEVDGGRVGEQVAERNVVRLCEISEEFLQDIAAALQVESVASSLFLFEISLAGGSLLHAKDLQPHRVECGAEVWQR